MPRIKRKKIKFDEKSLNELMQESYNDTHNLRSQINNLFNLWKSAIKENNLNEINSIGKDLVNLLGQQDKVLTKKLDILKILKEIVTLKENKKKENNKEEKEDSLSEDEQDKLLEKIAKLKNKTNNSLKDSEE